MLIKTDVQDKVKNSSSGNGKSLQRFKPSMKQVAQQPNPLEIIQRVGMDPHTMSYADAMVLQRTVGNRAVIKLLSKLRNDQKTKTEDKPAQLKLGDAGNVQSNGEYKTGIPVHLRAGLETLSHVDLSDVQVHYNSDKPKGIGALAYTQGNAIHLARGQEKHLPHEGWHAVQQKQGRVKPTLQMKTGVTVNDDAELEAEADIMGNRAASIQKYTLSQQTDKTGYGVSIQREKDTAIQLKKGKTKEDNKNNSTDNALDILQTIIDVVGFIPAIGDIADALNAIISIIRGKIVDAVFSAIAIIPGIGSAVAAPFKAIFRAAGNTGAVKKAIGVLKKLFGNTNKIMSVLDDVYKGVVKLVKKAPDILSSVNNSRLAKFLLGKKKIAALLDMVKTLRKGIDSFISKVDEIVASVKNTVKKFIGKEADDVASGVGKAITAPTNRNGLRSAMEKISPKPFAEAQAHHGLPWNYREWFAQRGLNVNDPKFGAWVKGGGNGGHQSWSKAYDNVWNKFITDNPNATAQQVEKFYNSIRTSSKWGGGF